MDEEDDEAGHKRRPIRAKLHPSSQDQDRTNGDAGKKRPFPYGAAAGAKGAGEGEVKSPLLPPSVSTMASRQQPRRAAATAAGSSAGGMAPPSPTPSSNANTGISQQQQHLQQEHQQIYYDNTLHCYCGKAMAGSAMIACDQCHVWFHSQCVGMTNEEVNNWPEEEPYLCHRCHPASKCLKPNNGNAKAAPKKRAMRK